MLLGQGQDPLFMRDDSEFPVDSALEDPKVLALIERREDELVLHLLEEGVSEADFKAALDKNPEGYIARIMLSLGIGQ